MTEPPRAERWGWRYALVLAGLILSILGLWAFGRAFR
jgi:hypothetical protein